MPSSARRKQDEPSEAAPKPAAPSLADTEEEEEDNVLLTSDSFAAKPDAPETKPKETSAEDELQKSAGRTASLEHDGSAQRHACRAAQARGSERTP